MPGHSHCLPLQRPKGLPVLVFPFVLVAILVETSRAATSCSSREGIALNKTTKLARLMRKESGELQKLYISSQGDFYESFCQMPIDNIPDTTITGQTPSEKLQSIYTTLKVFYLHLAAVEDQQIYLQEPSNPLLDKLRMVKAHTYNMAENMKPILQCLQPNEPISEPSWAPTQAPARNVFQQKVYGCVVLTQYKEFLLQVVPELKAMISKVKNGHK
ncbi:hypothetical protein GN956_G23960 [Arapaima gigas]